MLLDSRHVFRIGHRNPALADAFVRRFAECPAVHVVDEQKRAIHTESAHYLRLILDHGPVSFFALPQSAFRRAAICDFSEQVVIEVRQLGRPLPDLLFEFVVGLSNGLFGLPYLGDRRVGDDSATATA
jgi:hypothetical protein